jgi:titin
MSGQVALGNAVGISIFNGSQNLIGVGGPFLLGPGAPNIVSGNNHDGVQLWGEGTQKNIVAGNLIGTDNTGQLPLGNGGHGVFLLAGAQYNVIGTPNNGNVIAYNGAAGVSVGGSHFDATTKHNVILSNSIFDNAGLGIDLGDDGVTPNTLGGPHNGPNDLQNFPQIQSVTVANSTTTIVINLNSIPKTTFWIQIFANPASDPLGHNQGKKLIATVPLTTNAGGFGSVTFTVAQDLTGQYLTTTATNLDNDFETSEFSDSFLVDGN